MKELLSKNEGTKIYKSEDRGLVVAVKTWNNQWISVDRRLSWYFKIYIEILIYNKITKNR